MLRSFKAWSRNKISSQNVKKKSFVRQKQTEINKNEQKQAEIEEKKQTRGERKKTFKKSPSSVGNVAVGGFVIGRITKDKKC